VQNYLGEHTFQLILRSTRWSRKNLKTYEALLKNYEALLDIVSYNNFFLRSCYFLRSGLPFEKCEYATGVRRIASREPLV